MFILALILGMNENIIFYDSKCLLCSKSIRFIHLIDQKNIVFTAEKIAQESGQFLIRFSWNDPAISFSELLTHIGNIPLPPYIERAATNEDKDRYQTTYAKEEGSVA